MHSKLIKIVQPFVDQPKSVTMLNKMKQKAAETDSKFLTKMAGTIKGLDTAEFSKCMESDKYYDRIRTTTENFEKLGFNWVPVLLINGQYFPYNPTLEGLSEAIDSMGEVVRGNYRDWANPSCIDSVTNYEAYKGLYSSFNTDNFFEIAWTLNRLSGPEGLCRGTNLYSFADNHDVDRIAGKLKDIRHLHPLYCLLFCMPGIPSVYYGSEFGIKGAKGKDTDAALRPEIDLPAMKVSVRKASP